MEHGAVSVVPKSLRICEGVVAVCVIGALMVLALPACADDRASEVTANTSPAASVAPRSPNKLIGLWRERDSSESYTLKVALSAGRYWVEYPRSFKVPWRAYYQRGGELILHDDGTDVLWTITYDPKTDRLAASGKFGTFTFDRVLE